MTASGAGAGCLSIVKAKASKWTGRGLSGAIRQPGRAAFDVDTRLTGGPQETQAYGGEAIAARSSGDNRRVYGEQARPGPGDRVEVVIRMRAEAKDTPGTLTRAGFLAPGRSNTERPPGATRRGDPDAGPSARSKTTVVAGGEEAWRGEGDNAVARDRADRDRIRPAMVDYLRHARERSGRRPMELAREYFRLHRGRGRLTWPEYVQYGVYDRTRYSPDDQSRFLTNTLHWPITRACCDMTWQAATEDKWLCSHILAGTAVRVPETLAVIDRGDRDYPGTRRISTAGQLRDFMTSPDVLPLFGKENRGICSFGAFVALEADAKAVHLKGEGWLGYDACMERFIGATPYLLQRLESNHSFFDRYTASLATVRICLLVGADEIKLPFAVLKLPSRDNVADSFWRPGNLACNLDVQSGVILTVRTRDRCGTMNHTTRPETGEPLLGETVPMWDRVLELARVCAPVFQPVRYQSMDIAIAPDGPVLIEVNTGGGFDLPQLASGEGFLTDDVAGFFRSCGYRKL